MTRDEFEVFALLPENRGRHLELVNGEIIEMVSSDVSAVVGATLIVLIGAFVRQNRLGYVTGKQGGYRIGENNLIPDLAFVSKQRRERPQGETYATVVPELVV